MDQDYLQIQHCDNQKFIIALMVFVMFMSGAILILDSENKRLQSQHNTTNPTTKTVIYEGDTITQVGDSFLIQPK